MSKSLQAGFSLIEVLISVFVLALGVIGAAGMQLTALRTTQQSGFQTSAVELAAEMADKMRANASQMKLPNNLFLQVNYQSAESAEPAAPGVLCYSAASNCNAEQLAAFEIYEWKKRIKSSLPRGRALICRDARPWDDSARAFTWACSGGANENAPLVIKLGWQEKNPDGSLIKDGAQQFPPSVALAVEPYSK
ncbi:type IV pilus modification protein PilV [soil metagenome]